MREPTRENGVVSNPIELDAEAIERVHPLDAGAAFPKLADVE